MSKRFPNMVFLLLDYHIYTYIYIYIYIYIYNTSTHTHTNIHKYIYTHTQIHIYINIAMINPNNASHTIVTLPQIKDMLATTTATTTVKIKARPNNIRQMETTPGALTKTIITIKE